MAILMTHMPDLGVYNGSIEKSLKGVSRVSDQIVTSWVWEAVIIERSWTWESERLGFEFWVRPLPKEWL